MKVFITLLSLLVLVPALGATPDRDATLSTMLDQVRSDFQDLALDLPFEKITGGREQAIRDRFKDASRTLMEAGREVARDSAKSRELTRDALGKFRRVGLLLPFAEIDLPDEMMDKFLANEDRLFYALKVFEGSEQPPQNEEVWRYNGQAWKALKGAYSLREAQEKCASVMATQTTGWHMPSGDDFVPVFLAMKNPTRNPIFGTEAAGLGDVWTGQADPKVPGSYYVLNFQTTKWSSSGPLGSYRVICIGKDNSGTSTPPVTTPPVTPKPDPVPVVKTDLEEGGWQGACEDGQQSTLTFTGNNFLIRTQIFYDSVCTMPKLIRVGKGDFKFGSVVSVPTGAAKKIDYFYRSITTTPLTDQEVRERNAEGECGIIWQLGKPEEVMGRSCGGVTLSVGVGYYTIFGLDTTTGTNLYQGQALTPDFDCSSDAKRPTSLYPVPMVKQSTSRR